jgi:hypothetical protein
LVAFIHKGLARFMVNVLRILVAFAVASFVIWFAYGQIFPKKKSGWGAGEGGGGSPLAANATGDFWSVPYAIAFDAIVFTVAGLAVAVAAAPQWQTALLLSGTCLLIGAFFGLLFGYPQGVAQSATTRSAPAAALPAQTPAAENGTTAENGAIAGKAAAAGDGATAGDSATAGKAATAGSGGTAATDLPEAKTAGNRPAPQAMPQKNLIAESASTLGKVLAGFTLAKAEPLIRHFHYLCDIVGPALGLQNSPDAGFVLAGAIILYFFATGFFSGLLLPSYFMSGKFG